MRRIWDVAGGNWRGAGAAVLAGTAVSLSVVACGSNGVALPPARARVYTAEQACLLTGAQGISGGQAARVWAGMEAASLRTHAKVSYLAVEGPATEPNALPFLGTLLVRKCGVIVTSGQPEQAAALTDARRFPSVRFVLAGDSADGPVPGSNVTFLPASSSDISGAIAADTGN
jgi:hypothetical protein